MLPCRPVKIFVLPYKVRYVSRTFKVSQSSKNVLGHSFPVIDGCRSNCLSNTILKSPASIFGLDGLKYKYKNSKKFFRVIFVYRVVGAHILMR